MMKELARFFEGYSFPSSKIMYPTNKALWDFALQTEGHNSIEQICKDIVWVLKQNATEHKEILRYINQLAHMGPIRFKKTEEMLDYLKEMLEYLRK